MSESLLQLVRADRYREVRSLLLDVYREIYADEGQVFHNVDRFAERADMYASLDGWSAVLGRTGDNGGGVTGYAFGAPLPTGSAWWNSAADPLPGDFTREDGRRTFAVFEVMVRRPWRGTGEAHRLHERLLHDRPEQRATLLVNAAHPAVRQRYEQWGYRALGDQRPFADAPVYTMMLREPLHG
ncbi:GNAT family N-acetyltransferase [Streptomyces albofaciens]|uniref:GNAT family N-acetyltransferase n=1 Tax=Streptomyces albofaciens TaxID=66866 RepID=UPI00142EE3A2|nr:GNAT family N-acetyltransferase [Streptomyces albofaciens]